MNANAKLSDYLRADGHSEVEKRMLLEQVVADLVQAHGLSTQDGCVAVIALEKEITLSLPEQRFMAPELCLSYMWTDPRFDHE